MLIHQDNHNLLNIIKQKIMDNKGYITFSQFMETALYEPNLGYYNQQNIKIGMQGDFTTACEISPLFGKTVANAITYSNILELGAGSGKLACEIIKKVHPHKYYILERSAFLKQQQKQYLISQNISLHNVEWISQLPQNFEGSIIANEVLDALAVDIWGFNFKQNQWSLKGIGLNNDDLCWVDIKEVNNTQNLPDELPKNIEYFDKDEYITETHEQSKFLINSLSNILSKGEIILIDYGFLEHEYYHPNRNMGTLMCYHKHTANTNPLINIGLQDISCHVNFSLIIQALEKNNLEIEYFANQANFLIDYGILELLNTCIDTKDYLNIAKQAQVLLSEAEMGALFKVVIAKKIKN